MSRKSGALTYAEPLGPPRLVVGELYLYPYYAGNPGSRYVYITALLSRGKGWD